MEVSEAMAVGDDGGWLVLAIDEKRGNAFVAGGVVTPNSGRMIKGRVRSPLDLDRNGRQHTEDDDVDVDDDVDERRRRRAVL
jgi:hypothetical protein